MYVAEISEFLKRLIGDFVSPGVTRFLHAEVCFPKYSFVFPDQLTRQAVGYGERPAESRIAEYIHRGRPGATTGEPHQHIYAQGGTGIVP